LLEDKKFGKKKSASAIVLKPSGQVDQELRGRRPTKEVSASTDVLEPSSQADEKNTKQEVEDNGEGRLLLLRLR